MEGVKARIISGISLIILGSAFNLWGILPHYIIMAWNQSFTRELGNGTYMAFLPAIIHIPAVNYVLIGIGITMIIAGIVLLISGFRRYRHGKSLVIK